MQNAENTPKPQLKSAEKIGYGCGDLASCLYFGIFMNFLSYYYTDVFGISAAAVATMILITRTWDWINDPIMGIIADRTNTKMGKFRPWLVWMLPPWVILGVLTFLPVDLSPTGKITYAYVTYTLLMMAYTMINVPYGALMGVMTSNSSERTALASWRFIGANAGVFFVNTFLLGIVAFFGGLFGDGTNNEQIGFPLAVGVFGILSAGFFFITFKTSKERITAPKEQENNLMEDARALRKNGPWLAMIVISIFTVLWIAVGGSSIIYYFKYIAGDPSFEFTLPFRAEPISMKWVSFYLGISQIAAIAGVMSTQYLLRLFPSKRFAYAALTLLGGALALLFYIIPPDAFGLLIAHKIVFAFLSAPLMPLFWSMISDCADYGAYKLNHRSTALLFSAGTCSQKIGWAIGPAVGLYLLNYYGFEANVDLSEYTKQGIVNILTWIPAILAAITAGLVYFYKIDSKLEKEMQAALASEVKE